MKREDLKGILYTLVFAIAAYVLGGYFPIVGGPVFGILIGMLFARRRRPKSVESGIRFTGKKILQYAIILLGFEMNLFHVAEVGAQSLYVMIFTLIAAFGAAFLMGKALGHRHLRRLCDCRRCARHRCEGQGHRDLDCDDFPI